MHSWDGQVGGRPLACRRPPLPRIRAPALDGRAQVARAWCGSGPKVFTDLRASRALVAHFGNLPRTTGSWARQKTRRFEDRSRHGCRDETFNLAMEAPPTDAELKMARQLAQSARVMQLIPEPQQHVIFQAGARYFQYTMMELGHVQWRLPGTNLPLPRSTRRNV